VPRWEVASLRAQISTAVRASQMTAT
jgi:hypothetical protein